MVTVTLLVLGVVVGWQLHKLYLREIHKTILKLKRKMIGK